MINPVDRCLIVPAAYTPLARALCAGIATGGSGEGMLQTALSPDGKLPATHYISQGMIEEAFADLLPLTTFDADGVPTTRAGQHEKIVELSGGTVTLTKINALMKAVDVTEQDAFTAMARLGLKMVQAEI